MTFGQRYLAIGGIYCPTSSDLSARWGGASWLGAETEFGARSWSGNCRQVRDDAMKLERVTCAPCSRFRPRS